MSAVQPDVRVRMVKILVVGNSNCGKSSIVERYTKNQFQSNIKSTLGVDFALKEIVIDSKNKIQLQLWDIAGQERFGTLTGVYYRQAVGALVVFDINHEPSLKDAEKWKKDLDAKIPASDGQTIPCLLIGNKSDLKRKDFDPSKIEAFCEKNNFLGWFATSAKENSGIEEAFAFLLENILIPKNVFDDTPERSESQTTIKLSESDQKTENSSCSC